MDPVGPGPGKNLLIFTVLDKEVHMCKWAEKQETDHHQHSSLNSQTRREQNNLQLTRENLIGGGRWIYSHIWIGVQSLSRIVGVCPVADDVRRNVINRADFADWGWGPDVSIISATLWQFVKLDRVSNSKGVTKDITGTPISYLLDVNLPFSKNCCGCPQLFRNLTRSNYIVTNALLIISVL